jgi:exopolyphosphatase / guanosine-5'-triphosphate,3'-diphosphate pyrophosphatase
MLTQFHTLWNLADRSPITDDKKLTSLEALETTMADAILQNFDSLGPSSQSPILAAIDIGTNSLHMVVVQVKPELPAFSIIGREKDTIRLGDRDPQTGNLTEGAMVRAIAALGRYQTVAKGLGAIQIIAVATSATREAPNGAEFIARIEEELGMRVDLISGVEEARRIYLGVISGIEFDNIPRIAIDIGGGSTELILGDSEEAWTLSSTKIGAVRLSTELVTTDPISDSEYSYLQNYIRGQLERPIEEIVTYIKNGTEPQMVGTSGTIETACELLARDKNGNLPVRLHGFRLQLSALKQLVAKLRRMKNSDRAQMPGMSDRRAEIIIPGLLILQEAMVSLKMDSLTYCERSLREGVIVDWMLTSGLIKDRLRYQSSIKERSTLKIADKYGVDLVHGRQVAQFAQDLFDATQNQLHTLEPEARRYLWSAAILHNSGHFVSHSAHHKHSYYLIRYGELLGYSELEIEIIANIARYHRKGNPKKKHEAYQKLSKNNRLLVSQLGAILRVAIALDRRTIGAVADIECHFEPKTRIFELHLTPRQSDDDCQLELWSLNFKKAWWESEFNVKLEPKLKVTTP